MNEYIKRIPKIEAEIALNELQLRYLKSIVIKKKADGTDYKKKSLQSDLVIHDRTSYHNWYYISIPKSEEFFTQNPKSRDCDYSERYFLKDEYENLQDEINALILIKEQSIDIGKSNIKRLLFLNDYLNQYLMMKKAYLDIIDKLRQEIQKAMEEVHPEYAILPLRQTPISTVWDNMQNFNYEEDC